MNAMKHWLERATGFDWLTNLSAFVSVAVLLLVVYGFRRYTVRPRTEPIDYMGTGIWLLALVNATRLTFWDLVPDFFAFRWLDYGLTGTNVNWAFNIWVGAGAWFMLKGFFMLVNERAPGKYNLFTAVFYPRQIRLTFASRPKLDPEE